MLARTRDFIARIQDGVRNRWLGLKQRTGLSCVLPSSSSAHEFRIPNLNPNPQFAHHALCHVSQNRGADLLRTSDGGAGSFSSLSARSSLTKVSHSLRITRAQVNLWFVNIELLGDSESLGVWNLKKRSTADSTDAVCCAHERTGRFALNLSVITR